MMSDRTMRGLFGLVTVTLFLVGALAGVGWHDAAAQEEGATDAESVSSSDQEPVQREGDWVDIFFGNGIDKETRSVSGEGTSFPVDGERVYCLTRVHGLTPPTTVTHVWYHENKTMARVDLSVGSENWRTWSYKTYLPAWTGSWEVKVLNEDGMVLGSAGFEVK